MSLFARSWDLASVGHRGEEGSSSTEALLKVVRAYAEQHINSDGVIATPLEGVFILRETAASQLQYAMTKPMVALVLQGRKHVAMGPHSVEFGAGQSLLITMDVPTVSQVITASLSAPYYSVVVELDVAVITELAGHIEVQAALPLLPLRVDHTELEVTQTVIRLLTLFDRPQALAILGRSLVRELHYWLLAGQHGRAMRVLGVADSHAHRIARAIDILRAKYAQPLRMETLAEVAGMSLSTFHTHFRNVTTLTPLQFQKQLRLLEARRCMIADGVAISQAAYRVGYESVTQFTREYARMFGQPPARSVREAREQSLLNRGASSLRQLDTEGSPF